MTSEDEDEASHFHMAEINYGKSDFKFAQLDKNFWTLHHKYFQLDWRLKRQHKNQIRLKRGYPSGNPVDDESLLQWSFSGETTKSKTKMRLKSNGGTMEVSHQAAVNGYHSSVWFSENSITNIIALSNLRLKYLVIYRSNEMVLIIHR